MKFDESGCKSFNIFEEIKEGFQIYPLCITKSNYIKIGYILNQGNELEYIYKNYSSKFMENYFRERGNEFATKVQ